MSVRTNTANPLAWVWQALFSKENKAVKQRAVSSADVASMPRNTQLLLAHSLQRNDPYLTLQDGDEDAACLISDGLLKSIECPTIGIACYRIQPFFWHQLKTARCQLVNVVSMTELASYRRRKIAEYPWVW